MKLKFFLVIIMSFLFSTSVLANEGKLSMEQVLDRVDYHVESYIHNDVQGSDRGIYADRTLMPLYDLNDEVISYLVSLKDSNNEEVGIMITSSYENGSVMSELLLDDIKFSDFKKLTENNDNKILYLSFSQFGFK